MNFVIEHLSKRFEDKVVLRDICFTFTEGRIYGLLGRNGAGKTTLFNCLNRDLKADGGAFWLETDGRRSEVTADDIGYVLSTPTVPEFLTGREFLRFFLDINEQKLQNPKPLDAYFDDMSIAPEDRDKLMKDFSTTSSSPWLSSTISSHKSSAKSIICVEKMVMRPCLSERRSCFISSATTTSSEVRGSSSSRIFGCAMMLMSICILFFIPWE